MTKLFQLGQQPNESRSEESSGVFSRLGFRENPFPDSGVQSSVFFEAHMETELHQLNTWLTNCQHGIGSGASQPYSIRPLAISGAIGVGKTHLLSQLELGLSKLTSCAVTRKSLAADGGVRLLLANWLGSALAALRFQGDTLSLVPMTETTSALPLLDEIVARLRRMPFYQQKRHLSVALKKSLLRAPLEILSVASADQEADLRRSLSLWILRSRLSSGRLHSLSLSGGLDEGHTIQVIADLLRIARELRILHVWFVLIDQLEDVFRPGVLGPARRARLLTDLRSLIDEALEGAPIALLLAWNTRVDGEHNLSEELAHSYRALWQRLETPINLPGLRSEDIWPFARRYLEAAEAALRLSGVDAAAARKKLGQYLDRDGLKIVMEQLRKDQEASLGNGRYAPRRVLYYWRELAVEVASKS